MWGSTMLQSRPPKRGTDAAQPRDGGQSPTTRGKAALLGATRCCEAIPQARHGRRATMGWRGGAPHNAPKALKGVRGGTMPQSRPPKRGRQELPPVDAAQIRDGGKTRVFPRSFSAFGRKRHTLEHFFYKLRQLLTKGCRFLCPISKTKSFSPACHNLLS